MILAGMEEWIIFLGRTHPMIVHLPIGILFVAVVLEFVALLERFAHFRQMLSFLWFCAAVSGVLACIAGFALADQNAYDEDTLSLHRLAGIGVVVISTVILLLRRYAPATRTSVLVGCSVVAMLMLTAAGHLGGTLTHGEGYLTEAFADDDSEEIPKKVRPAITNVDEAVIFRDLVEPVLEQKCYRCHGAKRQKGKLRLDSYESIVAGGKNGVVIVPGDAHKSELYSRLLLPVDDKKRMPPKGKPQLSDEETELIRWWIAEAKADSGVKAVSTRQPEGVKTYLASLKAPDSTTAKINDDVPDVDVPMPSAEAVEKLRAAGAVVTEYAPGSPFLTVNCVNSTTFGDEEARLLIPLREQIVRLKAGHTRLSDEGMKIVTQLSNMTWLSLENTSIGDNGLKSVGELKHLRYLNLVGTKVTGQSASSIARCEKLNALYLWQTGYGPPDVEALRRRLPKTYINAGEQ